MTNKADLGERITRFERVIVFRVARGYFFAMAVLAVILFVTGAVMGLRGLFKEPVALPIPPPAPVARAPVDYAAALKEVDSPAEKQPTQKLKLDSQLPSAKAKDPTRERIEATLSVIRGLFPDPPYSWNDVTEKVCAVPTSFGCLRIETRVKTVGVASTFETVLKNFDQDEALAYLTVLARVLGEAPSEKRADMIVPIVIAEIRSREAYAKLEREHRDKVARLNAKYDLDVAANEKKHEEWRAFGIAGVGGGFALLILVSIFLAFLSIERHTRALERLARQGGFTP
jgi:hypothetical protein